MQIDYSTGAALDKGPSVAPWDQQEMFCEKNHLCAGLQGLSSFIWIITPINFQNGNNLTFNDYKVTPIY